ncbi:hypothetical protein TNCV_3176421 [Trichonephila clavipes]|nr:hypothetical protein TNCV_3176421 [Trichonephila clavipes]
MRSEKGEIINPDDPDQDNGIRLLNYCIVICPGQEKGKAYLGILTEANKHAQLRCENKLLAQSAESTGSGNTYIARQDRMEQVARKNIKIPKSSGKYSDVADISNCKSQPFLFSAAIIPRIREMIFDAPLYRPASIFAPESRDYALNGGTPPF